MGLTPVPPGHLACIVTSLERTTPTLAEAPCPPPISPQGLTLDQWDRPDPDRYRAVFRTVGAPWLWFSRLVMPDAALEALLGDVNVHICTVSSQTGVDVGLLELDLRQDDAVELSFFGLASEAIGGGNGRWLMDHALHRAALSGRRRLWVHSCTLDHPRAMAAYERAGFRPFARAVEVFADPRLLGVLPRDAAPQVPILD